ncbi:rhomboid family intramembrane serine protease [Paludisphaera rhizosphaerae]|uniref:rhomboid family intramembrane serine protease n=1 Tax=Paludisphaera rhizosphaerae TaxID=2711216 RepID=UPI0013EAD777|nr:rhomboid family intramembrane serine protease [Paludisphaera rhizosphaerae]
MNPRLVLREIRDYPATVLFSLSWVVVFLAMLADHRRDVPAPSMMGVLMSGMGDAHRFGDLTLQDLAAGEYWRLITCNFVHYSVIHIGMNLFAFYLLGSLLESWYGPWTLTAVYGITGVGGNLLSALARQAMGASPLVHSGGGSVVIMGLIGLFATAGWASKSLRDRELTWYMLKALMMTGALGLAFPRYIDNWGHAGGALAGLPIGLAHRWLLAGRGRPWTWFVGFGWLLLIMAGVAAQVRSDRFEKDDRAFLRLRKELDAYFTTYRVLQGVGFWTKFGGDARGLESMLRNQAPILDRPPTRVSYRRLLALAGEFGRRPATKAEIETFRNDLDAVGIPIRKEVEGRLRAYWLGRRTQRPVKTSSFGPRPSARAIDASSFRSNLMGMPFKPALK